MTSNRKRCEWPGSNVLMQEYHDNEWGVPLHDDKKLFEFLILDAFQAGLSWQTILNKRENFRKAFHNFNAKKISRYKQKDLKRLLQDSGIIRNKLKIESSITNAQLFLQIQKEFGSFDKYIWKFTNHRTIHNKHKSTKNLPAKTSHSDAMSKALKERGFKFCGSTICYAFMQAAGMVNDHTTDCFRHDEILRINN
jgi:DNA-3-methyladenine glycosylase I